MHLAALQHSRPPMGIRLVHPGQGVHMGQGMHMGQGVPMGQGRRAAAMKKHVCDVNDVVANLFSLAQLIQ